MNKSITLICSAILLTLQTTQAFAVDSCAECKKEESQLKKIDEALRVQKEYLAKNKDFLEKSKNNKKAKDSSYVVRAYAQATEIKIKIEKLTIDLDEAKKELENCATQCKGNSQKPSAH